MGATTRLIHDQEDDEKSDDDDKDHDENHRATKRKLVPGDFFGEISLLYNCKRTCTVKATKYSYGNYGLLDESSVHQLFKDYPEFE